MSGLLTLAGLATAVAALVLCGNDIRWQWYPNIDVDLLCGNSPLATTSEYGWGQEWRQQSSYGDPKWLEAECRTYMEMLTVRTERGPCPGPWPPAAPAGPGAGGPGRRLFELGPRPSALGQEVVA